SLGNLFTIEDVLARGYSPLALRYLFLSSLYRKELNFTWAALAAAQAGLERLWQRCRELPAPAGAPLAEPLGAVEEAVAADLNTSRGLAALWDAVRSDAPPPRVAATVEALDRVLGLQLLNAGERLHHLETLRGEGRESDRDRAAALASERERLRR